MKGKLIKIWAYGELWAEYTTTWLGSPRFNLGLVALHLCKLYLAHNWPMTSDLFQIY